MAFNDTNKAIVAFKNLLNKSNTDVTKELGNEAEGIFFNVHASTIWLDSINATPSVSVANGTAVQVTANLILDNTSNGHGYFAQWPVTPPSGTDPLTAAAYAYGAGTLVNIAAGDRVRNAIPPAYADAYEAKPFDTGAAPISVGDPRDWIYQYNSGIFFQQDNVGLAPLTLTLFVYTGATLEGFTGSGGGGSEWVNSVITIESTPPISPNIGDRYLIGPNFSPVPNGAWTGKFDQITEWNGSAWEFTEPTDGTSVKVDDLDDAIYHYDGIYPSGQWIEQEVSQVRAGLVNGTNTYSVTVNPPIVSYETDSIFLLTFQNNNTTTSTLNVNALGAVTIKKADSIGNLINLVADDIRAGVVYMLTYDGTYFQLFASGAGAGIIGPAEDGTYTDGLFTDFVQTTPIGTAVDRFNEILKSLVPPPAPILSDWDGTKAGTHVNGKLSFDDSNPIGGASYVGANNSPTPVNVDGTWTIADHPSISIADRFGIVAAASGDITMILNYQVPVQPSVPNPAYVADSFGDADKGELKFYVNGVEDVSKKLILTTLTALDSTSGGTSSGLTVSTADPSLFPQGDPFTFFYNRTGTARLKMNHASLGQGYNYVHVVHQDGANFTRTLARMEFILDDNVTATTYSAESLHTLAMTGTKKLSGIDYHTGGTAQYNINIDNAYRNTYYAGADAITHTGNSNSYGLLLSATQEALGPNGGNELLQVNILNKVATITSSGRRIINNAISLFTTTKRTVQPSANSAGSSINNILLDNVAASSTNYVESFNDETYRLIDGVLYDLVGDITGNPWDSIQSLNDGSAGHTTGLQVIDGKLVYPTTNGYPADFRTSNIINGSTFNDGGTGGTGRNYTGLAGNRTYIRYFRQVSPTNANFTFTLNGTGGTFVATETALTGNNIHVEIKCPTETGWMDAYKDFVTGQFLDGNGARNATGGAGRAFGTLWGLTIGTKNTANSSGYMVMKITVGPSFTGSFNDITFNFV